MLSILGAMFLMLSIALQTLVKMMSGYGMSLASIAGASGEMLSAFTMFVSSFLMSSFLFFFMVFATLSGSCGLTKGSLWKAPVD